MMVSMLNSENVQDTNVKMAQMPRKPAANMQKPAAKTQKPAMKTQKPAAKMQKPDTVEKLTVVKKGKVRAVEPKTTEPAPQKPRTKVALAQ